MTTTSKDITNFLDDQGINYNPIRMMNLLGKLDHEDLDVLYSILRHIEEDGYELEQEYQRGYDDGYDKGYDDGTSTEE